MADLDVVALLTAAGGAIGYVWARVDGRSVRSRLKIDLELLNLTTAGTPEHARLKALVQAEADALDPTTQTLDRRAMRAGTYLFVLGLAFILLSYAAIRLVAWYDPIFVETGGLAGSGISGFTVQTAPLVSQVAGFAFLVGTPFLLYALLDRWSWVRSVAWRRRAGLVTIVVLTAAVAALVNWLIW